MSRAIVRIRAATYLRYVDDGVAAGVIQWLAATALIVLTVGAVLYRREVYSVLRAGARRVLPEPPPPPPALGRPIEVIAQEVRRLGNRFRHPPPGLSFARFEGLRRAYDDVLVEACLALELDNLLPVLDPGEERDTERVRVEYLLGQVGWHLEDAT